MSRSERRLLAVLIACAAIALTAMNTVETLRAVNEANEYQERIGRTNEAIVPLIMSIAAKERQVAALRVTAFVGADDNDEYTLGNALASIMADSGVSVKGYSLIEANELPAVGYTIIASPASLARLLSRIEAASPRLSIASITVKSMPDASLSISMRVTYAR